MIYGGMIMDIPSFWVLVFAIFSEDEIAVEITNSVFDHTARYESYETCEIALLKQAAY